MQRFEYAGFGSGFGFARAFQHGLADCNRFNITLSYIKKGFDSKTASVGKAGIGRQIANSACNWRPVCLNWNRLLDCRRKVGSSQSPIEIASNWSDKAAPTTHGGNLLLPAPWTLPSRVRTLTAWTSCQPSSPDSVASCQIDRAFFCPNNAKK